MIYFTITADFKHFVVTLFFLTFYQNWKNLHMPSCEQLNLIFLFPHLQHLNQIALSPLP